MSGWNSSRTGLRQRQTYSVSWSLGGRSSQGPEGQNWLGVRDRAGLLSGNRGGGGEGEEEEGGEERTVLEQTQDPGRET